MSTHTAFIVSAIAAAFLAPIAIAQSPVIDAPMAQTSTADESSSARRPDPNDLHFSFTPGVWLARLGGDVKLGPSTAAAHINLENDFDLDSQETAFNFEMAVTKGERWQIDASGFDFSTDARGTFGFDGAFGDAAFTAGDAFKSSFDMTSVALAVSYWQWHPIDSIEKDGNLDLRFSYGGGIRWLDVDQDLTLTDTDTTASGDGEWLIPELILQLNFKYQLPGSFPVLDAFEVLGYGSIGPAIGGDGGVVYSLRAGIRFWFCQNASLDFGYRLLEADVQSDDYEFQGGLQGLFLSGTIRF